MKWNHLARALIAGCAVLAGTANAQILIGQTAGFSGPVASGVKETTDGARLYIDAVNAKGGVHGQTIELISLDDKFDPKRAAENARELITVRQVLALFLTRGTPHAEAINPLLEQYGIALVAPSTGAMVLHQPLKKYIFNVRATYQREAEKAVEHLNTMGLRRIAVVHTDDSFGQDGLQGAIRGLNKAKLEPVAVLKTDRSKPDFILLAGPLGKAQAQAIIWVGSGTHVVDGMKALRAAGPVPQVVTLSNNASSGFVKLLGDNARGVIVTQVFPSERSVGFPMVKEAQGLANAKNGGALSPAMLEGFAAAKVLVEGLQRAGRNPSRERLRAALEGIKNLNLGGLELGYGPDDHTGLEFVDLSIVGADGRFMR
ncbi:MAG: amino acid transporter substrate-binding protein [Ramlibacter sp.]|jgi:branched-chain amino acid transport system substrate-binding protein|nr:amino acid transporter substrate-binding protein [Ramlibacter sp.]